MGDPGFDSPALHWVGGGEKERKEKKREGDVGHGNGVGKHSPVIKPPGLTTLLRHDLEGLLLHLTGHLVTEPPWNPADCRRCPGDETSGQSLAPGTFSAAALHLGFGRFFLLQPRQ